MKFWKAGVLTAVLTVFIATSSYAVEADIKNTRVPADQLAAAKAMKNPLPATPENIAKGKEIFTGKGTCFTCHGNEGKGDGLAAAALDPSPRNFTNPEFHKVRTPGEMFWIIKNGSAGTGMISYAPGIITEDEAWQAILFERSLGGEK
jgi:mono/diheme cytochrome c family protein